MERPSFPGSREGPAWRNQERRRFALREGLGTDGSGSASPGHAIPVSRRIGGRGRSHGRPVQGTYEPVQALETYHEAVEALGLASTFANKEKWEMVKSDNRAERAIHWGAAAAPWRILAGRVAGIPSEQMQGATQARSEAAQILRDLPKQAYAKAIDEEMDRRVEDLGRAPRSTAKEVELVQADLRRVIKLLSPAVKAAREKLSQLAPSLPELARQLAKKAREAKAQSEAIAEKPDDEAAQVRREATELQREQRVLGGEITLFNAALRQEAKRTKHPRRRGKGNSPRCGRRRRPRAG